MATWNVGYDAAGQVLDYSTISSALASASVQDGDILLLWYSGANKSLVWPLLGAINPSKRIEYAGAVGLQAVHLVAVNATTQCFYMVGAECAGSVIRNLTLVGYQTVTIGQSITLDRCNVISRNAEAVYILGGSPVVSSCMLVGYYSAIFVTGDYGAKILNCTSAANPTRSFTSNASSGGTKPLICNCVAAYDSNGNDPCFYGNWSTLSSNNASTVGDAPGANAVDLRGVDPKFLALADTRFLEDWRVMSDSPLVGAGVNCDATHDIDGNPFVPGSYPIGCSIGVYVNQSNNTSLTTATPPGLYVPPAVADVRPVAFGISQTGTLANLDGTESAYQTLEATRNTGVAADKILTGNSIKIANVTTAGTFDEAARNVDPGEANVKKDEVYKIQNVSKTGTYDPLPTTPIEPAILAVVPADESLVVSVEPATGSELLPIYLRFFISPGGTLSTESASFSRTGAGDITITGLVNGTVYGVIAYHKGTCLGYASAAEYGMPDADLGDSSTISEVADAVKTELASISFSYPVTYTREWLPRKEVKGLSSSTIYATICPRGSEPVILSRSRSMKEYQIDIALQCKIDAASNSTVDPMVRLADQIAKSLRNVPLAGAPDVRWSREQRQPIFSDVHAEEYSVFSSVITVFYRLDE